MCPFMFQDHHKCTRCGGRTGRFHRVKSLGGEELMFCASCWMSWSLKKLVQKQGTTSTLKVQQRGDIPTYAGVCTVCWCAFDDHGRRYQCLTEEQALGLKSRGICNTCKRVMTKAAAIREDRANERISGDKRDAFEEPGFFGEEGHPQGGEF